MMNIGIFGGTFDPVHLGHLIAAEECRDILNLDKVFLIPAQIPPHKMQKRITDSLHRINMLSDAVADYSFLEVNDVEIHRNGPSYTIDTLNLLQPMGDLTLIMGLDSFYELETWHRYREILANYRVAVVLRPGTKIIDTHQLPADLQQYFPDRVVNFQGFESDAVPLKHSNWKIAFLPIPGLQISASEIRERVKRNQTIRFLVPPAVADYITAHSLYSDDQNSGGPL